MNLSFSTRYRHVVNGFDFAWVYVDPPSTNHEAKQFVGSGPKDTLAWIIF